MVMAHAHPHEHEQAYRLEQIGTIVLSGILGGIAVLAYRQGMLQFMLASKFHLPVLIGGITLLMLTAIRAVFFLRTIRASTAGSEHKDFSCEHKHVHVGGHACCRQEHLHAGEHVHQHAHADEQTCEQAGKGHDCGHDHGFSPWRYAILLLPVVLYSLNLPNQGLSAISKPEGAVDGGMRQITDKGTIHLDFQELEKAAYSPVTRELYEGHTGVLKGQFLSTGDQQVFSLVRVKINCCIADAVPLHVALVAPKPVTHVSDMQWVEVRGQIQFRVQKRRDGQGDYVPVLQVKDNKDIVPTQRESAFIQ
jgi:hypothetical protein